jgi:hypothetical protein
VKDVKCDRDLNRVPDNYLAEIRGVRLGPAGPRQEDNQGDRRHRLSDAAGPGATSCAPLTKDSFHVGSPLLPRCPGAVVGPWF